MNILLITADQWRGECLSAAGHACVQTPQLDALAADGLLFRRHYTQATPCGPSRASLLTGMYQHNHRLVGNGTPLDARHTNLALELGKAGYSPALFGYTDTAIDPRTIAPDDPRGRDPEGILAGFTPEVEFTGEFRIWHEYLKTNGYAFDKPGLDLFEPNRADPAAAGRGKTYAPARYRAEHSHGAFLTDRALAWLNANANRPWCMHITHLAPHPPFVAPAPYHAMYDAAAVPPPLRAVSPDIEARQHPYLAYYLYHQCCWPYTHGTRSADNHLLPDAEYRQLRATYYGMMSEVDTQIGRLLQGLQHRGMYDDTLIIFTSDHGEQLGDHWLLAKHSYFEQTYHIPLILRLPGQRADQTRGTAFDAFTEGVDIMPTILDALGLEPPAQCDGESLLPFINGTTPTNWRSEAYSEFDFRDIAAGGGVGHGILGLPPDRCGISILRGARYKYVHFAALPGLLFDLDRDPAELDNRIDDPACQAIVREYAGKLLSHRMAHADQTLANTKITPHGVAVLHGRRR